MSHFVNVETTCKFAARLSLLQSSRVKEKKTRTGMERRLLYIIVSQSAKMTKCSVVCHSRRWSRQICCTSKVGDLYSLAHGQDITCRNDAIDLIRKDE